MAHLAPQADEGVPLQALGAIPEVGALASCVPGVCRHVVEGHLWDSRTMPLGGKGSDCVIAEAVSRCALHFAEPRHKSCWTIHANSSELAVLAPGFNAIAMGLHNVPGSRRQCRSSPPPR